MNTTKKLFKYLIITFLITYICWGGLALLVKAEVINFSHPLGTVLHIIGGFGPTVAALSVFDTKVSVKSVIAAIFGRKHGSAIYLIVFAVLKTLVFGLSSRELNAETPLYFIPVILIGTVIVYGGNEELGWRGVMQPFLEKKLPFPVAAVITGVVWGIWHLPLWFVDGSNQQTIPFAAFLILAVLLSFYFAAVYRKSGSVFFCCLLHGLTNTLMSVFVIKINAALVIGLLLVFLYSLYLGCINKEE